MTFNQMDENTFSRDQSSNNFLLDFSAKRFGNSVGQDLIEDPSFVGKYSSTSNRGIDLGETSPIKVIPTSLIDKTMIPPKRNSDAGKPEKKVFLPPFSDEEGFINPKEVDTPPPSDTPQTGKTFRRESSIDFKKVIAQRRLSVKTQKDEESSRKRSSIRSHSSRKSRSGSIFFDGHFSESQSIAIKPAGKGMSFVGLVAMARKMGLIKSIHAYEDYMSKDQFNMIKDVSTGRFDAKEEKRTEQMTRLKTKLLLNIFPTKRTRVHQKRTNHFEWKNNLVPTAKQMYNKFKHTITKVIPPNGIVRVIWDMYTMLLIFYDLVMVPLSLSFDVPLPTGLRIWDKMMTGSFFLDILLNFDTGFYYKGVLVMDRKKIFQNYLKAWFWVDMLASFPYGDVIPDDSVDEDNSTTFSIIRVIRFLKFIKIFRFVRVFKLRNLFVKLESYIDLTGTATSIIGFLKLSLITLFIAHWFGCAWHFVSVWELESHPDSWLTRNGEVDADWKVRYVSSIYWATTTMTTLGYGDIVPITMNEKLLTIVAMLVASAIFAYTMNRINVILDGLETASEQYNQALSTITDYMRKKRVQKELQIKIKKYLEYALKVETSLDSNKGYLDAYLNQSLKNELLIEIHSRILLDNEIFMRFDNSLVMKVALSMEERMFSPEDTIFLETEDTNDTSIYIIHAGRVEIFNFTSNSFLKTLTRGNYFGEFSFFTGQPRSASARSTDFSALFLVKRSYFMEILKDFPLEIEKFHSIKDKLLIYQDQSVLNSKCYSCNASDHIVNECPKVHVVIPKTKFIQAYIEKKTKFMTSFMRIGSRSDRRPGKYNAMAKAAREIQFKIFEGECKIDKNLLYATSKLESIELSEHFTEQITNRTIRVPNINNIRQANRRKTSSVDFKYKNESIAGSSNLDLIHVSNQTHQIKSEIIRNAVSIVITPPEKPSKKQKKGVFIENDIDRIKNFVYYLPHNNFEILCPEAINDQDKSIFDYFAQTGTSKETVKRFIQIMRERIRIRKETLAKEKTSSPSHPSFLNRLGMGGVRSRFYRERESFSAAIASPLKTPKTPKTPKSPKTPKTSFLGVSIKKEIRQIKIDTNKNVENSVNPAKSAQNSDRSSGNESS